MLPEKQSLDEEYALDQPNCIAFIDFWTIYVNFGYYTLLVPFKLRKNLENNKMEMCTSMVQKILCGIVQIAILYEYTSHLWWSSRDTISVDQLSNFNSLCYVGYIAYHLALNATFWGKQSRFRLVFCNIQKLKFYDQTIEKSIKFWIRIMAGFLSAFVLLMGMTDIYLINTLYTHQSISVFYKDLQERARLRFLFSQDPLEKTSYLEDFLLMLLTLLQFLILLPSVILVPYADLFVMLVPLCVRKIMREFRQFCKNSIGSPVASERILKKYVAIRKFISNLNRAMGVMICTCVSISLPYYAAWIGISFFEKNVHTVMLMRVYAFFIIFFLALSLAADINKKGIEFFCWISSLENSATIPSKTISSLLVDLHSNQIALKGSAFFVVTFRFLGTIFGVIVTYSIITIQLQITRSANGYSAKMENLSAQECICIGNSTSHRSSISM